MPLLSLEIISYALSLLTSYCALASTDTNSRFPPLEKRERPRSIQPVTMDQRPRSKSSHMPLIWQALVPMQVGQDANWSLPLVGAVPR